MLLVTDISLLVLCCTFQVASIAILVLGIWTVVDRPYLEQLLGSEMYLTAAYILIATGCVIFFVSFLGCFGAMREVKCMLLTVSHLSTFTGPQMFSLTLNSCAVLIGKGTALIR